MSSSKQFIPGETGGETFRFFEFFETKKSDFAAMTAIDADGFLKMGKSVRESLRIAKEKSLLVPLNPVTGKASGKWNNVEVFTGKDVKANQYTVKRLYACVSFVVIKNDWFADVVNPLGSTAGFPQGFQQILYNVGMEFLFCYYPVEVAGMCIYRYVYQGPLGLRPGDTSASEYAFSSLARQGVPAYSGGNFIGYTMVRDYLNDDNFMRSVTDFFGQIAPRHKDIGKSSIKGRCDLIRNKFQEIIDGYSFSDSGFGGFGAGFGRESAGGFGARQKASSRGAYGGPGLSAAFENFMKMYGERKGAEEDEGEDVEELDEEEEEAQTPAPPPQKPKPTSPPQPSGGGRGGRGGGQGGQGGGGRRQRTK